jgi:choline dehydrogenase-like flavoprotein
LAAGDSRDRATWNHIVETVESYQGTVLNELGFGGPPGFFSFADRRLGADFQALQQAGLSVISSIFLPFRKKNLARLIEEVEDHSESVVYSRAVVKGWTTDSAGHVTSVVSMSPGGRELRVEAKHFVIAPGAIECARILLEIQRAADSIQLSADSGRNLGDHLSIGIADVHEGSLRRANSEYAPRFAGSWMRSFRFVESEVEAGVPRSFSHFVFENESPGFKLAKNVLTSLQARRLPRHSLREVMFGLTGLAQLGVRRFASKKLHIPPSTKTRLQLDIEQAPCEDNRIQLGNELDRYGRPKAKICWEITDTDMHNVQSAASRLLEKWQRQGAALPELQPRDLERDSSKPHDAYHPVGVCRMGTDAQSVVDLDCAVNGLRNVSVISTAVLPSAGTANPTFTMLCLAERFVAEVSSGHGKA